MKDVDIDPIVAFENPEYLQISQDAGFKIGCRLDAAEKISELFDIQFLDVHWDDWDGEEVVDTTREHTPEYVVAGDYNREGDNIDEVNEVAELLSEYSENVIVVPHATGQMDEIPDNCISGYSVESSYESTDAPLIEYQSQDVHLLGGSPERQLELIEELGDSVVSLDGNYVFNTALGFSRYWVGTRWYDGRHTALLQYGRQNGENQIEAAKRALIHWGYALREQMNQSQPKSVLEY